ncbi:MAG: gliding motility-associated ABC transporter permease subunit GldF [Bacteroidia bacterium]|nr:gliding motility-associated ABC transporter permease subunit GldF [Bacteroidia bacterium]MCF8426465.1 gliding motility-associated ABC transporter permease subunit GldF [Bacteroidia bacterium]MCF8446879.1 gliding motility-associated ABC transporter permease subunit GldF [Bacteroidia bacterium]
MFSIYQKEIRSFLSSLIAYVVMLVFLLAIGLFTWVLPDYNVFDYGYANLDTLFSMAPWMFIFLISAITMRSLSEEKKNGTIEIITTKPISDLQILLGKYFAGLTLVVFTLLPTLIYYVTIYKLGAPKGNLDSGAIWGSYLGLLFLGSCFVAIGMFASAVSDNQIVSFVVSMFLCFLFYNLFELIADFKLLGSWDSVVAGLGINAHYQSISRGVIDSRDVFYFIGFDVVFIAATKTLFGSRKW